MFFSVFWIDSGVNVKFWMDSQRLPWFWFSERLLVGRVSLVGGGGGGAAAVANVTSVATASCLGDSLIASFFAFCHLVLSLSLSLSRCLSLACCLSGFFFYFGPRRRKSLTPLCGTFAVMGVSTKRAQKDHDAPTKR